MTMYVARPLNPEPLAQKRIDYARMQKEWPRQKAALTRAKNTGNAIKVAEVCVRAVQVWDEIGAWPDDWMLFERTLNDLLHWRALTTLDDLVAGRVVIEEVE